MKRTWIKNSANYTLTGIGHEKGARHGFTNVVENVTDDQINKFGEILVELTGDTFKSATITSSNVIINAE